MADDWTAEMQEQFDQLQRALTDVIKTELRWTEHVLGDRFQKELGAAEQRLSEQYKIAVEDVRGEVRLLGEVYGGTLDVIRKDIRELDDKFTSKFDLYEKVLVEHSRDIAELKRHRQT